MLKKFAEGLVFGSGFAISIVAIWYLSMFVVFPMFYASKVKGIENAAVSGLDEENPPRAVAGEMAAVSEERPFHELDIDEQIKRSSVIALAKYEPGSDGKTKAVITEFLKKDPNVTIYYDVGDEYSPSSYYPTEDVAHGDGLVIFFTGSPATMKMSMSYFGDRIRSLGDLPIELLRDKCKQPNA